MVRRSNNSGFLGQTTEIDPNAKFLMNKGIFRLLVNKINTLQNCRNVSSFVKVGSPGQEVTWAGEKTVTGSVELDTWNAGNSVTPNENKGKQCLQVSGGGKFRGRQSWRQHLAMLTKKLRIHCLWKECCDSKSDRKEA